MKSESPEEATIAIMGATGTGKSSFISLLTGDDTIHVGHTLESTTLEVNTSIYIDEEAGVCVTLVDTPGFDDSRKGVTDTDILGKIANFLQENGGRKLNGIIYLHRISDPRFSGMAKKNLRVFRELCGDDKLDHVRIVTTFWNVRGAKGEDHEAALAAGVFKPFIEAGAKMIRHDKEVESAKKVISDLARLPQVTMKIQDELNAGAALGDTSAGAIIIEEMKELEKKHAKEMEELKKELEEAANENDEVLRSELDAERQKLAERMAQVEEDRKRLAIMRMPFVTRPLQGSESANIATTAMYATPHTTQAESEAYPHHQKGKEPDSTRDIVLPSGQQEAMEMIIATRATEVAGLREKLEKMGESNRVLVHEQEASQREIARLEAEMAELKKILAQLSQRRNPSRSDNMDEVVKAAVERALEEERRRSYANKGIKLADKIPLVPRLFTEPVLGGVGFGLDVVRSRFQQ